jgi:signal transduction histidine kinase
MEQLDVRTSYEQTIRKLQQEKETLLSAISQFYHDASQPLTSIGVWIELAKLDAEEEDDVEMAQQAYNHLHQLMVRLRTMQHSHNFNFEDALVLV